MLMLAAILAPWIAPTDPYDLTRLDLMDALQQPGSKNGDGTVTFYLGSDGQGRDMLSAMLYGLRTSILVGVMSGVIALSIGLIVGIAAAYFGGWVDAVIMRIVDLQLSFPSILVAMILLAVLGQGVDKIILALIIVQWAYYTRTVRSAALVERSKEYVEAAICLGIGKSAVMFRHMLRNCLPPLIVVGTVQVGSAIALEATLSFLGLGVACHQAIAWAADLQRLRLPDERQVLDQPLPGHSAADHHRGHQSRRRPPSGHPQSTFEALIGNGSMEPVLSVSGLTTQFFTRAGIVKAVNDVSFSVGPGQILGLVGESGSGKSVTGFSLIGLVDRTGPHCRGQREAGGARTCWPAAHRAEGIERLEGRHDLPGSDDDSQSCPEDRDADDRDRSRA